MKIIDRIYEYIEYKHISVARFERENMLSTGYLAKMKARSADIGETMLNNIIENSPDLSLSWLVLGEGSMLKSAEKCAPGAVDQRENGDNWAVFDRLQARIEALVAENALLKAELKKRPTVHLSADTQPQTMAV